MKKRNSEFKTVILLGLFAIAQSAQAKSKEPQLAPMVLISDGGQKVGEIREVGLGEALLTGRIVFSRAAKLQTTRIQIFQTLVEFSSEELFRQATLPKTDPRAPDGALLYCSGNLPAPLNPSGARDRARFSKDIQLCLVDADRDSDFEQGFIIGAKFKQEQGAAPISKIGYTALENAPLPAGGKFALVYRQPGGVLAETEVVPMTDILDGVMRATRVYLGPNPGKYYTNDTISTNPSRLPRTENYGPSNITFLGKIEPGNKLRFRIETEFTPTGLSVQMRIGDWIYYIF